MTKDEALKMARTALGVQLDALLGKAGHLRNDDRRRYAENGIKAIDEALAQPEPWEKFCDSNCVWTDHHPDCKMAQRKPLTDEEIMNIAKVSCIGISPQEDTLNFAKVIEAAHGIKEKNT